jgi:hypothetical protein
VLNHPTGHTIYPAPAEPRAVEVSLVTMVLGDKGTF